MNECSKKYLVYHVNKFRKITLGRYLFIVYQKSILYFFQLDSKTRLKILQVVQCFHVKLCCGQKNLPRFVFFHVGHFFHVPIRVYTSVLHDHNPFHHDHDRHSQLKFKLTPTTPMSLPPIDKLN